MEHCIYCNPEEGKLVVPILDTEHVDICVLGNTPIGNRRKTGQLQIFNKVTGQTSYADISHCPVCGKPLYLED